MTDRCSSLRRFLPPLPRVSTGTTLEEGPIEFGGAGNTGRGAICKKLESSCKLSVARLRVLNLGEMCKKREIHVTSNVGCNGFTIDIL